MLKLCQDEAYLNNIRTQFKGQSTSKSKESPVKSFPGGFPVVQLRNVLDDNVAISLRDELLNGMEFHEKCNDLYHFYQTDDIRGTAGEDTEDLRELRETLCSQPFIELLSKMTGIKLTTSKLDIAGQMYSRGHHLLCHDDDIMESNGLTRRLAFILYLVSEDWSAGEDGGTLDIIKADSNDHPLSGDEAIVGKVVPEWNSLAFFEVTPTSYHQVSEVLSDQPRLSLAGWFYGEPIDTFKTVQPLISKDYLFKPFVDTFEGDLTEWIRPEYLLPKFKTAIARKFLNESCVELSQWMNTDVFQSLCSELICSKATKVNVPVNVAKYKQVAPGPISTRFQEFIRTSGFRSYLSEITGLTSLTGIYCEYREFDYGDYTLLHDQAREPVALDLIFTLTNYSPDDEEDISGSTVYMDKEETLMSVTSHPNKLTLVYRADPEMMRFTKYLKQRDDLSGSCRLEFSSMINVDDDTVNR